MYISVNKHVIRKNLKGENEPPIAVRKNKSSKPFYAHGVSIIDKNGKVLGTFRYSNDKPILNCGARLVFETDQNCILLNENGHTKKEQIC